MKYLLAIGLMMMATVSHAAENWIVKDSPHDVAKTVGQLTGAVEKAGAKVFATVDHAAGAASIDAKLDDMVLVIFGNPKLGTPILQAAPHAGIDLPIRVLVWSEKGATKVGYLEPEALKARYKVEGADKSFKMMTGALDKLTGAAIAE